MPQTCPSFLPHNLWHASLNGQLDKDFGKRKNERERKGFLSVLSPPLSLYIKKLKLLFFLAFSLWTQGQKFSKTWKYLFIAFLFGEPQATFNALLLSVCKSISSSFSKTLIRLTYCLPSFLFVPSFSFRFYLCCRKLFFFFWKWGNSSLCLILLRVLESLEGSITSSRMWRLGIARNPRQYFQGERTEWWFHSLPL